MRATGIYGALTDSKLKELRSRRGPVEHFDASQSDWTQINQYLDSIIIERDEMIRNHTFETADLRNKNRLLVELVQKLENEAVSESRRSR